MSDSIPKDFPPGKDQLTTKERERLQSGQSLAKSPIAWLLLRSLPMAFMHVAIIGILLFTAHLFVDDGAEMGKMIDGKFMAVVGTFEGMIQSSIVVMLVLAIFQVVIFFYSLLTQRALYRTFLKAHQKSVEKA